MANVYDAGWQRSRSLEQLMAERDRLYGLERDREGIWNFLSFGLYDNKYEKPREFLDDLIRRRQTQQQRTSLSRMQERSEASQRRAERRADDLVKYGKERDKHFDRVAESARRAADRRWQYSKGYMDEQRERERKRQRDADFQKKKSMTMLEAIQNRRNQLIKDVEDAPSSVMQQAKRNYDMDAQNKAAMAGSGGDYRAMRQYSDQMSVADANLMGATASARNQENLSRLGAKAGLLSENAKNAMQQYALSTGEGNSFLPAMQASGSALQGLLGAGQLSLAGAGQTGRQALGWGGMGNMSARTGMGASMGILGSLNQERALNLEREKFDFQRVMAPISAITGLGGELLKSFGGGSSQTPG